jgi:hypothetical protein
VALTQPAAKNCRPPRDHDLRLEYYSPYCAKRVAAVMYQRGFSCLFLNKVVKMSVSLRA